jgi:hypothetical protein
MLGLLKTLAFSTMLRQGAVGARRRLRRALICGLVAACGGLTFLVGVGFLLAFGHEALALSTDNQTANLVFGAGLAMIGAIAIAAVRATGKPSSGQPLEAPPAMTASLPAGDLTSDIERLLSRNAGTLAAGAFVAGLLMATRRR